VVKCLKTEEEGEVPPMQTVVVKQEPQEDRVQMEGEPSVFGRGDAGAALGSGGVCDGVKVKVEGDSYDADGLMGGEGGEAIPAADDELDPLDPPPDQCDDINDFGPEVWVKHTHEKGGHAYREEPACIKALHLYVLQEFFKAQFNAIKWRRGGASEGVLIPDQNSMFRFQLLSKLKISGSSVSAAFSAFSAGWTVLVQYESNIRREMFIPIHVEPSSKGQVVTRQDLADGLADLERLIDDCRGWMEGAIEYPEDYRQCNGVDARGAPQNYIRRNNNITHYTALDSLVVKMSGRGIMEIGARQRRKDRRKELKKEKRRKPEQQQPEDENKKRRVKQEDEAEVGAKHKPTEGGAEG